MSVIGSKITVNGASEFKTLKDAAKAAQQNAGTEAIVEVGEGDDKHYELREVLSDDNKTRLHDTKVLNAEVKFSQGAKAQLVGYSLAPSEKSVENDIFVTVSFVDAENDETIQKLGISKKNMDSLMKSTKENGVPFPFSHLAKIANDPAIANSQAKFKAMTEYLNSYKDIINTAKYMEMPEQETITLLDSANQNNIPVNDLNRFLNNPLLSKSEKLEGMKNHVADAAKLNDISKLYKIDAADLRSLTEFATANNIPLSDLPDIISLAGKNKVPLENLVKIAGSDNYSDVGKKLQAMKDYSNNYKKLNDFARNANIPQKEVEAMAKFLTTNNISADEVIKSVNKDAWAFTPKQKLEAIKTYASDHALKELSTKYNIPKQEMDALIKLAGDNNIPISGLVELAKFSLEKKIPFADLLKVGSNTNYKDGNEKLAAMKTYAIMYDAVKNSNNLLPGTAKFFQDAKILDHLLNGKIKIDYREVQGAYATYHYSDNTMTTKDINLSDPADRAVIVHEMVHASQDAHKMTQSLAESEYMGHGIGMEYYMFQKGVMTNGKDGEVNVDLKKAYELVLSGTTGDKFLGNNAGAYFDVLLPIVDENERKNQANNVSPSDSSIKRLLSNIGVSVNYKNDEYRDWLLGQLKDLKASGRDAGEFQDNYAKLRGQCIKINDESLTNLKTALAQQVKAGKIDQALSKAIIDSLDKIKGKLFLNPQEFREKLPKSKITEEIVTLIMKNVMSDMTSSDLQSIILQKDGIK